MKKATRLLILTAFVVPLLFSARAYAGGPGQGQRPSIGERSRLGQDPFGSQTTDPFSSDNRTIDGFRAEENPLSLRDPIGDAGPDINRNNLYDRAILSGRDHFPTSGRPAWDPSNTSGTGGGTAPIDGGISLLLAAGLGLGLKKARARKEANDSRQV
jgi:hypothetical protein